MRARWFCVLGALAWARDASTESGDPRLETASVQATALPGIAKFAIRVHATDLQGQLMPLDNTRVLIGGRTMPTALLRAKDTDLVTGVVIVAAATYDFRHHSTMLTDAIKEELVDALPDTTHVAWLSYGGAVAGSSHLRNKASLEVPVGSDDAPAPPVMLDAVERALDGLIRWRPAAPHVRRVMLVVSDGIDASDDRSRVSEIGQRAKAADVAIYPIAFSPTDVRRPLLALGELARLSGGTFRWLRTATPQAARDQARRLRVELDGQAVLTGFAPAALVAKHALTVTINTGETPITLNASPFAGPQCGRMPCDGACLAAACVTPPETTDLPWMALAVGAAALTLVGATLWLVTRRRATSAFVECLSGKRRGERIPLERRTSVGSHAISNIVLNDPRAAPLHATFDYRNRTWWLDDAGSAEGTFVNGKKIQSVSLRPGDVLRLGNTELRFGVRT